jgi:SSS family solute:Na+ symporter
VVYRYRETRAMTLAQFFEMRYSRSFRVFAGLVAFIAGVLNYALFPAVSGRFFMYYCNWPDYIAIGGVQLSVFGLLMAFFLGLALLIVLMALQLLLLSFLHLKIRCSASLSTAN